MADYYNLLGHEWTLNHTSGTYRIAVGLNKNLPEDLEDKFKKMLKQYGKKTITVDIPVAAPCHTKTDPVSLVSSDCITTIMVTNQESKSCFSEIINQVVKTDYNFEKLKFIIVDNNTDNKEIDYVKKVVVKLKSRFPNVTLLQNCNKQLLSGAMNKALDACNTELFVYLCTKHTYIYDENWLNCLIKEMKEPGLKNKYAIGGTISKETGPHIQGGIFIAYTEVIKKIRYDAKKYPMVFMDVDLCRRILDAGYKFKEIDCMMSRMKGLTKVNHEKNIQSKKYKIIHSHETIEYRNHSVIVPTASSNKIKYSISMVCHNHVELTKKCLESVITQFGMDKNFELLIVDNNSTDGTKNYLEELKIKLQNNTNVQILYSKENQGFMTPQNYNASIASGEYLVILNNDLEVCPHWLHEMERPFLSNPKMAIVGLKQNPAALDNNGTGFFNGQVEYIEMSCAMIKNQLVKRYGLFDDKVLSFGYCEDTDFSLRMRERGYEIAVVALPIKHHRSSTMGKLDIDVRGYEAKNKYFVKQRWDYYFKNRNFNYKILFKRRGALGDEILSTGVLHRLKQKYPLSEITVQTKNPEIYVGNPDVKYTNTADEVDDRLFDKFFDLDMAYEKEPQNHVIDIYSKVCGVSNEKRLYLYPNASSETKIKNLFGDKRVAVVHCEPTRGWDSRALPLDKFRFITNYLRNKGFSILEVGSKYLLNSDINVKNTSYSDLVSIMKNAKIFVGLDSGPWHIAQAFDIPSVVPFGMIDPKYRVVSSKTFPVVVEWLKCLGCQHWQKAPRIFPADCVRDKKYMCMEMITHQMLQSAVDRAIQEMK